MLPGLVAAAPGWAQRGACARACNAPAEPIGMTTGGTHMADAAGSDRDGRAALADLARLVGKAVVSGLAASLALALVTLGLASAAHAQARPADAGTGMLFLRADAAAGYAPVPAVETDVVIHVTGIVARTRVVQTFHNPGAERVEGLYVFPLPESAAVDRLWLRVGSREIEGRVREKEEARRAYVQARREGRKAALVEQQRPNLFTNAVANIGPGESVRVLLEYQQTLAFDGGEYRLRFPLAVTPRYQPAVETAPVLHPAYTAGRGVNPVAIGVVLDAGVPLAKVASSYHEAIVEHEASGRAILTLAKELEDADRDFELVWAPQARAEPQAAAYTETVAGTDYALLFVVPPQDRAPAGSMAPPREAIFVIDTSGSMQGASIAQAKLALLAGLATLAPRDRFNVVEFNSRTRPLWPDALPATAANVRHAGDWVGRLRADGGTEMAPALAFALDARAMPGTLRQVVFITDGAVANEDALLRLIAQRLGATRLFTVGIGPAPNGHFMTKAAQFGRGTFTFIGDAREVGERMARLFARIEAPVLTDVSVRWADGTPLATFPERVPDLYLGEPVVVSAVLEAGRSAQAIVVAGTHGTEPWSVALTPSHSPPGERTGVGALWARARIASLMDALRLGADEAEIRPAVLEVALAHQLVSRYTSLVAVDVTPATAEGEPRSALVPVSAPLAQAVGELPQTGTAANLQIVLGLLALAAAAAVALAGRALPAPGVRPRGQAR